MKINCCCAFTLTELMVSVTIICLVASLGFASITFLRRLLVQNEITQLHATTIYLQQRAQLKNALQQLQFDQTENKYTFHDHVKKLSPLVTFGTVPNTKGPPAHPIRIVTNPITFKKKCITFLPTGILTPGTVYLIDTENNYQCALTAAVAQYSYVRTYKYTNRWHPIN